MIPDLDGDGNLPPGIHPVSWAELERCGSNPHRRHLLSGLRRAAEVLRVAGCKTMYVDGSFVTSKDVPSDFDGCWERAGMSLLTLQAADPVLLIFDSRRAAQKAKYFGELFPADMVEGGSGMTFLNFFQRDKDTGRAKGILALDLGSL
ncbi:MAG: hypothetical protein JWQ87_3787 [Candidatus Sulfotelmatobacter sp.]|nr:hypothetical protein [Candidatus Sulfotelmatobacter sp.]